MYLSINMVKQDGNTNKKVHIKDSKKEKAPRKVTQDKDASDDGSDNEQKPKVLENPRNTLKMGKFHRYTNQCKKKHRPPTNKKKIRDIERLLAKEGLPEELIKAKKQELKVLKKVA